MLEILHAKNFIFRNNTIVDDGKLSPRRTCRNDLFFGNCNGVTVSDCRWRLVKGIPEPKISLTAEDVQALHVKGNSINYEND